MHIDSTTNTLRMADLIAVGTDGKKRLDWKGALAMIRSAVFDQVRETTNQSLLFLLDGFDYLNPDGLIWLLLVSDRLKLKGNTMWLRLPKDHQQLSYLKSCGFQNVAVENFSISNVFDLDEVKSVVTPEGMRFFRVDLATLSTMQKQFSALFSMPAFLRQIGVSPTGETAMVFMSSFLQTIQETTKNIVQHSGDTKDQGFGYFVVSNVGKFRVQLCIGDAGRGFTSSLREKGIAVKDDFDGIKCALLYRYHRRGGEGLFRVIAFVSRLGGVIRIRSGRGEGFLKLPQRFFDTDEELKRFVEDSLMQIHSRFDFPGVQVQVDLESPRVI